MSRNFLHVLFVSLVSLLLSLQSVHGFGNLKRGSWGVVERELPADLIDNIATESVAESKHQEGTGGELFVQSLEDWSQLKDSDFSKDEGVTEQIQISMREWFAGHNGKASPELRPFSTGDLSVDWHLIRNSSETLLLKNLPVRDEAKVKTLQVETITVNKKRGKAHNIFKRRERKRLASKAVGGKIQDRKFSVQRRKRSLLTMPGTLWCGPGSEAEDYDNLGKDKAADSCCREHDHCPNMIERWAMKFGIFNHRLYSISDCECDKRLYKCLEDAGTPKAKVVSKWFFNLLGLSCFELSHSTGCVEYGWFGSCRRYGLVRSAKITTVGPVRIQDTAENATTTEPTLADEAVSSDETQVVISSSGSEYDLSSMSIVD